MPRYLVVANQTLAGEHLAAVVQECLARNEACSFHVVVPATHAREQLNWTEGAARVIAGRRLDAALARFRELGAEADGEVGDPSPMLAVRDAMLAAADRGGYDGIILSTLPAGPSRWLRQDLPHRVERTFGVPVVHVVGRLEPLPAG